MKRVRLVLNGKSAGDAGVRAAVAELRAAGQPLEVRCTWEGGDAERFVREAVADGVDVLVAGGGDGTLHEIVNAVMKLGAASRIAIAVLPLGTANDFARGCGIPLSPREALGLAARGNPARIDVARANGEFFVNVATGGFGAAVTAATPAELKRAFGGAAYALVGLLAAAKLTPYVGRLVSPFTSPLRPFIAFTVGNGRQAGGGLQVAPRALLDDGLLDLTAIAAFPPRELGAVLEELERFGDPSNRFVRHLRAPALEIEASTPLPVNLDGETHHWDRIRFWIEPQALLTVLPEPCPLLSHAPGG